MYILHTKHKRHKNNECIGVISYAQYSGRLNKRNATQFFSQGNTTKRRGRAAKEKGKGNDSDQIRHSHPVVMTPEAPNTLNKMTIWIAPSLFPFTNFVFSSHPIPEPENNENRARKQWSGVE